MSWVGVRYWPRTIARVVSAPKPIPGTPFSSMWMRAQNIAEIHSNRATKGRMS